MHCWARSPSLQELAACSLAQSWTQAEAAAWWAAFKKPTEPAGESAPTVVGQDTPAQVALQTERTAQGANSVR